MPGRPPGFERLRDATVTHAARAFGAIQSSEVTAANVEEELNTHLGRLSDAEWNTRYHDAIGLHTQGDYAHRFIEHAGHATLAGIHFRGGDKHEPFVHLEATTADPRSVDLFEQARVALDAYDVFEPAVARVWSTSPPTPSDGWGVTPDQHLLAATVGAIGEAAAKTTMTLEAIGPEEAIAFITPIYAHLAEASPELQDRVPPADLDGLTGCAEDGTLHAWSLDGERAGVIATSRTTHCLVTGSLMWEIASLPKFRGRGSAAAAQVALSRHLSEAHEPGHVLFGEIDTANLASRRTAER